MADASDDLKPDVPTTGAIVRSPREATALARKIAGERLPDEMRFVCMTCGWDKTLKFDKEEMAALDDDVTNYSGPCGGCGTMTLVPRDQLMGSDFKPIHQQVRENKEEDWKGQARVLVDTVKDEIMGGSIFDQGGPVHGSPQSAPGHRDDLPSADDVDLDGLRPQKSEE